MADIFISYSQADRLAVERLAAFLKSEGWSVWWDRSLSPGDKYRKEIMTQLDHARVVIVIWTSASIHSEWVVAEAARGRAAGKLIPVKEPTLSYSGIPLPFGEMHTEPLDRSQRIAGAVAALLSAPEAQGSMRSRLAASLRLDLFRWVSIIAIALSILQGAKGVLALSEAARWLVEGWHDLTMAFWTWPLQFFGITVLEEVVPVLTTALFLVLTAVGIRLRQLVSGDPPDPELSLRIGLLVLLLLSLPVLLSISGLVPSFRSSLLQRDSTGTSLGSPYPLSSG